MILGRMDRGWEISSETRGVLAERPSDSARRLYADSLTYDPRSLALSLECFGHDHVMLGTDYPFVARETPAGAVLESGEQLGCLDAAARRAVAGPNAAALLGLSLSATAPGGPTFYKEAS